MKAIDAGPFLFLLIVNIVLLIAGMFIDPGTAIIVLMPALFPVAVSMGIDPVHFGLVVCVTACTGMITPPFGLDLFVASSTLNKPVVEITRGVVAVHRGEHRGAADHHLRAGHRDVPAEPAVWRALKVPTTGSSQARSAHARLRELPLTSLLPVGVIVPASLTIRGFSLKNIQDGGEAILEGLRSLNVEYVISSPGSEWPSLWEALARQKQSGSSGPTYLDCGHETLAVAMATGYTQVTGRMQAVLLHAGAGLLQGSMAIYGARAQAAPMLVMSGESAAYGEGNFDPGPQWYRNLSIVGGPQRLVEPVVKMALQSTSVETLYHGVVRAGEIAQRTPRGPTYLCVSMEAMIAEWPRPEAMPAAAPPPASQPAAEDISRVAADLAKSRSPFILVERAGSDRETFDALVELAELLAIPVIDAPGASLSNFPKSHDLYLGLDTNPYLDEMDFVLLVENEAPWYPPSNIPKNAKIVAISGNPLRDTMVYQVIGAERYLEGDTALTLRLLTEALRQQKAGCRRGRGAPRALEGRARQASSAARSRRTEGGG